MALMKNLFDNEVPIQIFLGLPRKVFGLSKYSAFQ